jgi:hypothetical protein
MQYVFILKNEKSKNYLTISQFLVFFNLLGFVFLLINDEEVISKNIWLLFSIVVTAAYLFFAVIERILQKTTPDFWHRSIFGYCAMAWLKEGYWWFSILLGVFVLFDYLAHRKLVVKISDKKIILPALLKKDVEWSELSNLILKDDLLTIDFKNNKLFQHLIYNSNEEVDENKFNDFCKSRLTIDH